MNSSENMGTYYDGKNSDWIKNESPIEEKKINPTG